MTPKHIHLFFLMLIALLGLLVLRPAPKQPMAIYEQYLTNGQEIISQDILYKKDKMGGFLLRPLYFFYAELWIKHQDSLFQVLNRNVGQFPIDTLLFQYSANQPEDCIIDGAPMWGRHKFVSTALPKPKKLNHSDLFIRQFDSLELLCTHNLYHRELSNKFGFTYTYCGGGMGVLFRPNSKILNKTAAVKDTLIFNLVHSYNDLLEDFIQEYTHETYGFYLDGKPLPIKDGNGVFEFTPTKKGLHPLHFRVTAERISRKDTTLTTLVDDVYFYEVR